MSGPEQPEYTEEELRALEAEMERVTIDDVLLQTIVSLINLTARKAGLSAPQSDPARPAPDWEQVRTGIDAARALMPIVEPRHGAQLGPIRDALAQLQMHYARAAGGPGGPPVEAAEGGAPAQPPAGPAGPQGPGQGGPGDAQRTGRLWIPGQ